MLLCRPDKMPLVTIDAALLSRQDSIGCYRCCFVVQTRWQWLLEMLLCHPDKTALVTSDAALSSRQDGIAPNFTQKPVTRQENNGQKLLFECVLSADPAPTITWFRDNTTISAGGRQCAHAARWTVSGVLCFKTVLFNSEMCTQH